jgi:acyl-CoA synthetase (AMP-forming)/AMP-acid ligase II
MWKICLKYRYKIPRYIAVLGTSGNVKKLPMTLSGKVQKFKLRKMAKASLKNSNKQKACNSGLNLQDRFSQYD